MGKIMLQQEYISAENHRRIIRVLVLVSTLYILGHLLTALYENQVIRYDGWSTKTLKYDKNIGGAGGWETSTLDGIVMHTFDDTSGVRLNTGVQLGDKIITVNGKPWEYRYHNWANAEQNLLVLRDGEEIMLHITTASFPLSHRLRSSISSLTGLIFWLVSFIIWLHKPYHRTVLVLVATLQTMAVAITNPFFLLPFSLLGEDIRIIGLYLFPVLLIHLHLRLADIHLKHNQLCSWLLLLLYGTETVLIFIDLVAEHTRNISPLPDLTLVLNTLLGMVVPLFILIWAYLIGTPVIRKRLRIVLVGSTFAYLFWIVLLLLPTILLDLDPAVDLVGTTYIGYIVLLLLPIVYLTAISNNNLFQADKIINRAIISLGIILILGVFYLLLLMAVPNLLPSGWLGSPLSWGVITLLLVTSFAPLRTRLQNSADRLLYGGWYDYRSVVDEISRKLSGIVDGKQLGTLLVDRLSEIMHLEGAALLLQRGNMLQPVHCTGGLPQPTQIALKTPLAAALRQAATPLGFAELQRHLPALQKQSANDIQSSPFDTWVPLVRNEQLLGVLLLGKRYGAESLLAEDRELLATLAWNAATAAENVQLVDTLEDRATEISQLYDRVVSSREEERKRLARDLHDQIIQDLINLNHAAGVGDDESETVKFMRGQLQTTIEDLRRVCTDLRPSALDDLSFKLAVEGYVADVSAETQLPISFIIEGDESRLAAELSDPIATALFRVLQETLTNIKRHAHATQVAVVLQIRPTTITLQICDDGVGFAVPAQLGRYTADGHFGLAGMQERLSLVGGRLVVDSAEGKGTCLQAII